MTVVRIDIAGDGVAKWFAKRAAPRGPLRVADRVVVVGGNAPIYRDLPPAPDELDLPYLGAAELQLHVLVDETDGEARASIIMRALDLVDECLGAGVVDDAAHLRIELEA
jgi:hypothetical protein